MNAQEIIEKLAELKIKDKHLAWEDFDSDEQAAALAENIGEYKIVTMRALRAITLVSGLWRASPILAITMWRLDTLHFILTAVTTISA